MGRTILVVDDDRADLALLTGLLAVHGYRVRATPDVAAALEEVIRRPPDLVLTDRLAPQLDGFVLLARLRLRGHLLPVVVMHRLDDEAVVADLVEPDGVTAIVSKPTGCDDAGPLLAMVARLLARSDRQSADPTSHPPQG